MIGIMYSLKRKQKTHTVSNEQYSSYQQLQYNPDDVPDTEKKWNASMFVEKTHWGCVYWPK